MVLKGDWNSETTYDVGDVARYSNGKFYQLASPCKAGVPCVDALYWCYLQSPLQECAKMIMDMTSAVESKIPTNINDEGVVLTSGDNEYLVSIDASGEDPEVIATLIEEET